MSCVSDHSISDRLIFRANLRETGTTCSVSEELMSSCDEVSAIQGLGDNSVSEPGWCLKFVCISRQPPLRVVRPRCPYRAVAPL